MAPPRLLAAVGLLACVSSARAVGPDDVFILTNKNVPESRALAEYYCQKRGVPRDHVLAFDLPAGEDISRDAYNERLAAPLREKLKEKKDRAKVLLSTYGVPLRVGPDQPTAEEKAELEKLRPQLDERRKKQQELQKAVEALEKKARDDPKGPEAKELPDRKKERAESEGELRKLEDRRRWLEHAESVAAVDSELALLWHEGYDLRRWQLNLLYFQVPDDLRKGKPPVVMTARLDGPHLAIRGAPLGALGIGARPARLKGPNVALLQRLIDQAIEVEAKGLQGKVYVDARGIPFKFDTKGDQGFGYGGYDESLREMAKLLRTGAKLDVTLDDKPELFAPYSCDDCALYCGWYSHARYVPCCRFAPGAVAYHIASSEAVSLRDPHAPYWCPNLLQDGVIATLGPVSEPYTVGFPKPAEFFGFLTTGEYTLVECYWKTELFASWMTVLVGDPLYNPYKKAPKLKPEQVKPSPEGGSFKVIRDAK
jgi:hypothetical protein